MPVHRRRKGTGLAAPNAKSGRRRYPRVPWPPRNERDPRIDDWEQQQPCCSWWPAWPGAAVSPSRRPTPRINSRRSAIDTAAGGGRMISAAGIVIFGDLDEQGRPPRQAAMSELRPGNPRDHTPARSAEIRDGHVLDLPQAGVTGHSPCTGRNHHHRGSVPCEPGLTISLTANGAPVSLTKQPLAGAVYVDEALCHRTHRRRDFPAPTRGPLDRGEETVEPEGAASRGRLIPSGDGRVSRQPPGSPSVTTG